MSVYLVTGGAGFIGSHLVDALLAEGHTVHVVDDFSTGKRANIAHVLDSIHLHEISITNLEALTTAMQGVEYVYHQAAIPSVPRSINDPVTSHNVNVTGSFNVLQAARANGVRRVIYAASSSAYGDVETDYKTEDQAPRPLSPYGAAKLMGEYYMQVFYHVYGLETVSLRYFNVFGPRQDPESEYAAVIPKFITRMLQDRAPIIYGDGLQSRDFTYIDNVVYGNRLAATAPDAPGHVINVACGGNFTLLDLVEILNDLMGKDLQPQFDPPRPGDIKHSRANIGKACQLLDYEQKVDFVDGIARTLAWFRDQQKE